MGWKSGDSKKEPKAWRKSYRSRRREPPPQFRLAGSGRASTDIERALKLCLMALRVKHQDQVKIGPYTVDFLVAIPPSLEMTTILEADGFWHQVQRIRIHDLKRDRYLTAQGYRVVRLTYNDLTTNSLACVRAALGV